MQQVRIENDFESWRKSARRLLEQNISPQDVLWRESGLSHALLPGLAEDSVDEVEPSSTIPFTRVPKAFVSLARSVACHRDEARWALLYRVLWRITRGQPRLLEISIDDDVHRLLMMEKSVRFDAHKMKAFVRFRRVEQDGEEHWIAWHRPEHHVVRMTAPFFAQRFASMRWSILTPDLCASWDGEMHFSPGVASTEAPKDDALEDLWRTYYASTFNPARIKLKMMRREMPARYWATMPETRIIPDLLRDAPQRVEEMMATRVADYPTAEPFLPKTLSLSQLRQASKGCQGCPLYKLGTQTVFGEGPKSALVMFVGEQPGDQEDRAGRPFVGPAGQLLDEMLDRAGVDRSDVYVTNAVKHFKWEPRGTRRIHSKPSSREVQACKPWLVAEVEVVKPRMIVALGATAAQALFGPQFRITRDRGNPVESQWAPWSMATIHPSALLRMPDDQAREEGKAHFLADLKKVARQLRIEKKSN